jgi:small-conductance mechanosensitive channel
VGDYGSVQSELNRLILERFRAHGIELPSSHHQVRLVKE